MHLVRRICWLALVASSVTARAEDPTPSVAPVGRWPNGIAYSLAVDAAGRYAYAASGGAVLVCDLGSAAAALPRAPVAEIRTEGFVFGLAVDRGDLYVAGSRAGLFRCDVSNPADPGPAERIGEARDVASDVAVRGDLVVFADGGAGIAIFRRGDAGTTETARLPLERGRALGVALGDGFAVVACGDGDVLRVDLSDPAKPRVVAKAAAAGIARSVALTPDGRYALVAEDMGDLTLRDAATLAVVKSRRFVLPANPNPGPQKSPKPETQLAVARIRVSGARGCVGLEGTPVGSQISPFTPEYGAWKGEPHYDPRAATATIDLAPGPDGVPSLAITGFADEWRNRTVMSWIKDVAPLPGGDLLALDFVTGAFRLRPADGTGAKRRDGLPALVEVGLEIETRAGAIDCVPSPSSSRLLYASSDIGGLQVFDISDRASPRLIRRVPESGGTFCAAWSRTELGDDGVAHPIDYVFINNFFRVTICRIDPADPDAARVLPPLWITLPEAIRGKPEFEALGLTPRSYRIATTGDFLDVVATNTVFGWQRFSIPQVLAWTGRVNIYATVNRPPEYARDCPPLFRAVASPDNLADPGALRKPPFARGGKVMSILASGSRVILGSGAQRDPAGGGGRGGRGEKPGRDSSAPFDGYLQYFDLRDAVVDDPVLGPLRFPRATRFIPGGEIQIGLAMRGDELFVADTAGYLRVFDFTESPRDPGPHGENCFSPRPVVFENRGHYGLDSLFDVMLDGPLLHVAAWSAGYLCLAVDECDPGSFLKPVARFDSPGLPISIALLRDRSVVVAEHDAGFLILPPVEP